MRLRYNLQFSTVNSRHIHQGFFSSFICVNVQVMDKSFYSDQTYHVFIFKIGNSFFKQNVFEFESFHFLLPNHIILKRLMICCPISYCLDIKQAIHLLAQVYSPTQLLHIQVTSHIVYSCIKNFFFIYNIAREKSP